MTSGRGGGGSTAAVLWLMIALVFLPIVAVHIGARLVGTDETHAAAPAETPSHS